ncbi:MAG: hypothetical protein RIC89_13035 [Pseudomonadales bacterium]
MDAKRIVLDQTVLVKDGTMESTGEGGTLHLPHGTEKINGWGLFRLPGISDMHAHISGYEGDEDVDHGLAISEHRLLTYAATGVTPLRDTSGSSAHSTSYQRLGEDGGRSAEGFESWLKMSDAA